MDEEDFLCFRQVSRSGRILKKSIKRLEAEKSLEEAWLPSRKKPWYFNRSIHHSYKKKKKKNGKRFNSKSPSTSTSSVHSTSDSSVHSTSDSSVSSTSASSVFSTSASSIHSTSASSSDEYEAPSPESTSENDNQSCSSSPNLIVESACKKFKNVPALQDRQDRNATDHKYCSQLMRIDRKPEQSGVLTTAFPEINPGGSSAACVGGTRDLNKNMLQDRTYQRKLAITYQYLPLREISEMVGEAWQYDPRKDNYFWIWTPDQLSLRNQITNISPDAAAPETVVVFCPVPEVPEREGHPKRQRKNCVNSAPLGIAPIDVAAHLKLLGDGLTEIAQKILNSECEPSSSGVYSVMLDSLLCSTGALLCLTREIPGLQDLPVDSFKKTLDHIAYFLPGI